MESKCLPVIAIAVILSMVFTPVVWAGSPGVYVEVMLPNGYTHRFGPIILEPGDRIAFGFDKLVLNGSGYVEFNISPQARSIAALVMPYDSPDWNAIASNDEAISWRLYISQVSDHYEFMRRDNSSNAYVVSDGLATNYTLTWVIAYTYTDRLEIQASTTASIGWPGTPANPASKILIGSNMFNGVEQQAQRWIGEIHAVVLSSIPGEDPRDYTLDGAGLELLFDPSWFNPETDSFIALTSTGVVTGRLIGSAQLASDTPRMWVLKNSYSDPYLHVSLLPYGSILRIYDSRGRLLGDYTVLGDTMGSLVADYLIPWPPLQGPSNNGGSRVLDWLALVSLLVAFIAPALGYYYGLIGGLTGGFFSILSVILSWYEYRFAEPGVERDLWLGFAGLGITLFIFSVSLGLLRGLQGRRRRIPRWPRIDV